MTCLCVDVCPDVQEHGYVRQLQMYMQVTAHNMMRLAAWDSTAILGIWDIDEFLVFPNNATWQSVVGSGCLGRALTSATEVPVNASWVWQDPITLDLPLWVKAGSLHNAVHRAPYRSMIYHECQSFCKSFIIPSGPWTYGVHGSIATEGGGPVLPWSCGRLMHFASMWVQRQPTHNWGPIQELDKSVVPLAQTCRGGNNV